MTGANDPVPAEEGFPSGVLDFVRVAAVASVVCYHAAKVGFGWQGVHVFLVLSGFGLAFSQLRRPQTAGWGAWYRRRASRILPATLAMVGIDLVLALAIGLFQGDPAAPGNALRQFALDVSLLRNFHHRTLFGFPNASLWFVPLLVGLYAVFPLLWRAIARFGVARVVVAAVALELAYRTAAVFWCDGVPVAVGRGAFWFLPPPPPALDRLPPTWAFQGSAPFGHFPARLGEFALGVAAAHVAVREPAHNVFRARWRAVLGAGALFWFAGTALVHLGPVGWVWSDLLIAAGASVLAVAVAEAARRRLPVVFARVSRPVGTAFPLFLAHMAFFETFAGLFGRRPFQGVGILALLVAVVAALVHTVRLLGWIERRFGPAEPVSVPDPPLR